MTSHNLSVFIQVKVYLFRPVNTLFIFPEFEHSGIFNSANSKLFIKVETWIEIMAAQHTTAVKGQEHVVGEPVLNDAIIPFFSLKFELFTLLQKTARG